MRPLSCEQVRRLDKLAIGSIGISGAVLMENAGRGITDAIGDYLGGGLDGKSVGIVAGGGNNGGDGFVVARHVMIRRGRAVVFLVTPADKITGEAAANLAVLKALGGEVRDATGEALADLSESLATFDLLVDAIGGTGITGELRGDLAEAVGQINAAGRPIVAVDIPTGLDCDTGTAPGEAVRAVMTVTMVARKIGFDAPGAAEFTGKVVVVDIGVPPELLTTGQA